MAGHQREHGADRVRRLGGHVDGELAGDAVEVGHATASLDRSDVDARDVHVLLHHHVRLREGLVRRGAVAGFPVEDAVVLLVLLVGPQDRRSREQGLERIDDDRQRVVIDLDRLDAVGCRVPIGRDHGGHFLRLVHYLLGGQHHLGVRHEGRHPVQVVLGQGLAGDHRQHSGDLQRLVGVDGLDLRVRERAAHDVHVQHAGELDVVDVVAPAADEARILLALHRVPHPAHLRARLRFHGFPTFRAAWRPRTARPG